MEYWRKNLRPPMAFKEKLEPRSKVAQQEIIQHVKFLQKAFHPNFTFKFIFKVPKSIYALMNLHEAISKYTKFHILFMKPVNNSSFYGFTGNLSNFVT